MYSNKILIIILIAFVFGCSGYKIENEKVYYVEWNEAEGKVNREIRADAATLKILENKNYAIDKSSSFYKGMVIDSADPNTFKPLSDFISKDKSFGYYGHKRIPNSDGQTFELVDGNYTRDKNDVYYIDSPLNSKSPGKFEILKIGHENWSRDGISYYFTGNKVPLTDYQSFEILDEDCFFAKDKFNVFKKDIKLEGVDAKTFKFIQRCIGQDKFGCHDGYERCDCPPNPK